MYTLVYMCASVCGNQRSVVSVVHHDIVRLAFLRLSLTDLEFTKLDTRLVIQKKIQLSPPLQHPHACLLKVDLGNERKNS